MRPAHLHNPSSRADFQTCRPARIHKTSLSDDCTRFAVLDDIGRFVRRQVPVDRCQSQARPLAGKQGFYELASIAAHQRDGVAGLKTLREKESGKAVCILVKRAKGSS
jgi:hypothetical protein